MLRPGQSAGPAGLRRLLLARCRTSGLRHGEGSACQARLRVDCQHPAAIVGREQEDKEVIKVNKLTSIKTQLPYEYYSIPYCQPEAIKSSAENLGEVLRGDRIENSLYEVCSTQLCSRCKPASP